MIKLLGTVPKHAYIAVSGGVDSMAALDFLRNGGKRELVVLHFNHGTEHAKEAEGLVRSYCLNKNIPAVFGKIDEEIPKGASREDFWRKKRYAFFERAASSGGTKGPVITCHHINDVVETWLFTSFHGNPMLIPPKRDFYIRPFLLTKKDDLVSWGNRREVPHVFDPSNNDLRYMRNYIRHKIVPSAKRVNPGLEKVLRRKIMLSFY
tara:strand:+ start:2175 stop:2795 length:621 start_codon:yes stop_codon:yes gene_type:complete